MAPRRETPQGRGKAASLTPLRRAALLAVGLSIAASGLALDLVRLGSAPGLGPFQLAICALGCAVALLGVLPAAARVRYARGALALGSAYLAALVAEVFVMPSAMHWGLVNVSLQGMVRPSSWGGFELTPGWSGRYEDGVRGADVEINALGDRDDLPSARDAALDERVLLVGDSFAFGFGLEKVETVESQIEQESRGRAVAYNLGVGGYGPGDALEHYREHSAFSATHTFFLLYGNDLRVDNCAAGFSTAVDGVIVPRKSESGAEYTEEEVERKLAAALAKDGVLWLQQIKASLLLSQLRGGLLHLIRDDFPLAAGAPEHYTKECALAAAQRADEMRTIAKARGERFAVVVVPTPGETRQQTYHERMQACIRELERRAIPVLEVRSLLAPSDYFEHHEHLNPSGAHKVAQAILASVESAPAPVGSAAPRLSSSTRER